MADSASELDLESDASSIDGHTGRCDQLQRQMELLQQQNRMLKIEIGQLNLRIKDLINKNDQLRRNSVSIQAQAEQEEEYISNTLQRQISELKKDKEALVINFEEEEEWLINQLNRKFTQLERDKEKLEKTLVKEQETQVNKLKHRIERLESESKRKQKVLDKLRHDKIELENALEQEQEAFVNKLWKKMEKLEDEKRELQKKLENVGAPLLGTLDVRDIAPVSTASRLQNSACSCVNSLRSSLCTHSVNSIGGTHLENLELGACQSNITGRSPSCPDDRSSNASAFSSRPSPSSMDFDGGDETSPNAHNFRSDVSFPENESHQRSYPKDRTGDTSVHVEGTVVGAAYVAKLRDEVVFLRNVVAANQAKQYAHAEQEQCALNENARLRHLLQMEVERKAVLSQNLSGSESSLEMDDERHLHETSCVAFPPSQFRGTSDGRSSPQMGPFMGPVYASAVNAAAASARSVSPAYCRECGQPFPANKLMSETVTTPTSSDRFVKPRPRIRPPNPSKLPTTFITTTTNKSSFTFDRNLGDEEEDDEHSKTPPGAMLN